MNNEEFERKVEFIINQQARFDANIQRLEEGQARIDENHVRLQEAQKHTEHVLAELAGLTRDGFKSVIKSFQELDWKFKALADAQILTEESVRNLNATLNRHLIEGHNGA